jgi:hypothetical protein
MKIFFGQITKKGGNGDKNRRVIQFGFIERKGLYVFIHFKSILTFRHCLFWRNDALKMISRKVFGLFRLD